MPEAMDELTRKLTIKLNVLKRCTKEMHAYEQEYVAQMAKIEKMRLQPVCCPHELAKQEEVLKETADLLPYCRQRIEQAQEELRDFLVRHPSSDFDPSLHAEATTLL